MNAIAKQLDLDRCMLWGDRLRVLLNSNHISYGEINELLREKGIFLDSSDRSVTVPLLSACLLTPEEFGRLIARSYSRESSEKYKTDKLTLVSDAADWRSSILENFDTIVGGLSLESGHEFVDQPTITSPSQDSLEITYRLKKEDYSKDFIDQELQFSGGLTISKRSDGVLTLEFQRTHTSKETDRINGIFSKSCTNYLKSKGVVNEPTPQSIKFDNFNNEERIQFFLLLTGATGKALNFDELSEIEIIRDESAGSLPNDPAISWMEGKVKKIRVSGEKLDKLGLITNKGFHRYCFLIKMSARYQFQSGANKGSCAVDFWFGGKTAHDRDFSNTEMNISIERISKVSNRTAEQEVRRSILRSLCDLRDTAMNTILSKRSSP
ncbi:MAG: hypothetical protein Q7U91_10540 [Sideroxyarcus sp.]|nr:hypothetical protein [Sideroxyarcus sp.]